MKKRLKIIISSSILIMGMIPLGTLQAQVKNFNYFKLIVVNENDELLLVNFKDQWEPVGRKYNSESTTKEVLEDMASEMGVKIGTIKLRAFIAKYYGEATHPIMFNYVTAEYKSGTIQAPPGCKDISWYPIDDAIKIIPFEGMRIIMNQIFKKGEPNQLWAGALQITSDPVTKTKFAKIIEPFYTY